MSPEDQRRASAASAKLRLQVSGSAPLPESLKQQWEGGVGGGQVLIERYGMTEIGVALSTGFEVEKRIGVSGTSIIYTVMAVHRYPFFQGHVGIPLPNTEVRLWDSDSKQVITDSEQPGEIQVRGPGIFNEYWGLPEATAKEFDGEWFKTGDIGVRSGEYEGMYKILGRNSVDIIKVSNGRYSRFTLQTKSDGIFFVCFQSGGEKLSALDIERSLLELDYITDVAVVGVPNEDWGQIVSQITETNGRGPVPDSICSPRLVP